MGYTTEQKTGLCRHQNRKNIAKLIPKKISRLLKKKILKFQNCASVDTKKSQPLFRGCRKIERAHYCVWV